MHASAAECFAMKTVGEQAKEFRLAKKWNTTRMAKEVGTSRQNIEHLEARGDITPKYIAELAKVMGMSVDALLGSRAAATLTAPMLTVQASGGPTQLSDYALDLAARFDQLTTKDTRFEAMSACVALLEARASQSRPTVLKTIKWRRCVAAPGKLYRIGPGLCNCL